MRGDQRVTACFFGDGAVAEGEFHECLNLAALWELPVLFCCENNRYAMGTALDREHAADRPGAARRPATGMPSWAVDGMDVVAVEEAARRAAEAVRAGGGPHFLELRTYRFRAHSMYDPERYRDKAEIARVEEARPDRRRSPARCARTASSTDADLAPSRRRSPPRSTRRSTAAEARAVGAGRAT